MTDDISDIPVISPIDPPQPVVHDGRAAPHCMVRFVCPKCHHEVVRDAYLGPLTCVYASENPKLAHGPTFMRPVTLQLETE